ncbi:hypothetical protein, variant 2 [Aphanomyces astaci]|uniref:Uncharacterized protein n=1 Tax=Aphanomyces astaci TaxID=112090 RepID=W4FI03_APHAT|nr:hypothetical protein, variant 2 [Aphanomyces astaci]ETV66489.1 hypothetical protein, variant 2 [Aphanomyces astaci]|eukprot:XP_009844016.1 hypothetical protein, variant 2 [Aphanomyces astaci]
MATAGVPSYLRSTSSSKAKRETKNAKTKAADFPIRRTAPSSSNGATSTSTDDTTFRVRPPAAPISIAIPAPSVSPKVGSTGGATSSLLLLQSKPPMGESRQVKFSKPDSLEKVQRTTATQKSVPNYMRHTVSRGYKEGDLQHPADAAKSVKPAREPAKSGAREPARLAPPSKRAVPLQRTSRPSSSLARQPAAASAAVRRRGDIPVKDEQEVKRPAPPLPPENQENVVPEAFSDASQVIPDEGKASSPDLSGQPGGGGVDEYTQDRRPRSTSPNYMEDIQRGEDGPMADDRVVAALRDEIKALTARLHENDIVCREYQQSLDTAERNMEKMTNACLQYKQKCETYADSSLTLKRQHDTLEQDLIESKMQLTDLKNAASVTPVYDASVLELKIQVMTMESEKSQTEHQLEHLNRICGELQIQINTFETNELAWQTERDNLRRQDASLRETVEALQQQLHHAPFKAKDESVPAAAAAMCQDMDTQDTLRAKIHALELTIEAKTAEINRLTEEHVGFQEQALVKQRTEMKEQLATQERLVSTLETQLAAAALAQDSIAQDHRIQRARLDEDIQQLLCDKASLESQAADHVAKLTAAEEKICELTYLVEESQANDPKDARAQVENQLTTHNAIIASYEAEMADMKAQLSTASAELATTRDMDAASNTKIALLESEGKKLEDTVRSLHEARHHDEASTRAVEAMVVQLQTELEAEKAASRDLRIELAQSQSFVESFQVQLDELERQKVDSQSTYEGNCKRIFQLEGANVELENAIREYQAERERVALELASSTQARDVAAKTLDEEVCRGRQQATTIDELHAKIDGLETEVAKQSALAATYAVEMAQLDAVRSERNVLVEAAQASDATIVSLGLEVAGLDSKLNKTISEYEQRLGEAAAELDHVKTSASQTLVREVSGWKEKYEALTLAGDYQANQLKSTLHQLEVIQASDTQSKATLEQDVEAKYLAMQTHQQQSHDDQVKRLTSQLDNMRTNCDDQIEALEAQVNALRLQLSHARGHKETCGLMEQDLAHQILLVESHTHQLLNAQKRVADLTCQNLQLKEDIEAGSMKLSSREATVLELQQQDSISRDKIQHLEAKLKAFVDSHERVPTPVDVVVVPTTMPVQSVESEAEFPPLMTNGVIVLHADETDMYAGVVNAKSQRPTAIIPSLAAVPRGGMTELQRVLQGSSYSGSGSLRIGYDHGYFLGKDAANVLYDHPDPALRGILTEERLFQDGAIASFEHFEGLLKQMLAAVGADTNPDTYKIVMTHKPLIGKAHREKMVQSLFEAGQFQSVFLTTDAQMSLRAVAKSTGLVVDVGADTTYIVPIYEDMLLEHAVVKLPFGQDHVVNFMVSMLLSQDCDDFHMIPARVQRRIARSILDSHGLVASDFFDMTEQYGGFRRKDVHVLPTPDHPLVWVKESPSQTTHPLRASYAQQLPSGRTLTLEYDIERFVCPELLWNPSLDPDCACKTSLHAAILKSLSLCDPFLQEDLIARVVCCGVLTSLPGFKERLYREVQKSTPQHVVGVEILPKSLHAAFTGATMYAQGLRESVWISRDDYDRHGPAIVHSKCF